MIAAVANIETLKNDAPIISPPGKINTGENIWNTKINDMNIMWNLLLYVIKIPTFS
jgi:hypothetical protein